MPAPIALTPLAWTALRVGATAALAIYAMRKSEPQPKDAWREHVLNDVPEKTSIHRHQAEGEESLHASSRFRRVIRLTRTGPGIEIDAATIGRLRFRRVD